MSCGESCHRSQKCTTFTHTHLQSFLLIGKQWLNELSSIREVRQKVRKGVIFSFSDCTDAPEDRLQIALEAFPSANPFQIKMCEICQAGLQVPISMTTVVLLDLSAIEGLHCCVWIDSSVKNLSPRQSGNCNHISTVCCVLNTVKMRLCLLTNSICSSIHIYFEGLSILSSIIMFHCFSLNIWWINWAIHHHFGFSSVLWNFA